MTSFGNVSILTKKEESILKKKRATPTLRKIKPVSNPVTSRLHVDSASIAIVDKGTSVVEESGSSANENANSKVVSLRKESIPSDVQFDNVKFPSEQSTSDLDSAFSFSAMRVKGNFNHPTDEKENRQKSNSFRKIIVVGKEILSKYNRNAKVDSSSTEKYYHSFIQQTCCYHGIQVNKTENADSLVNNAIVFESKDRDSSLEYLSKTRGVLTKFNNGDSIDNGVSLVEVTNMEYDEKNDSKHDEKDDSLKDIKCSSVTPTTSGDFISPKMIADEEDGITTAMDQVEYVEVYVGNQPNMEIILQQNNLTLILENNETDKPCQSEDSAERSEENALGMKPVRSKILKGLKEKRSTKTLKENTTLIPMKKNRRVINVTRIVEKNRISRSSSLIDAVHTKQTYLYR